MASRVDSQVVRPLGGGTKIPVAIRAVAVPPMVSNANRRDRLKRQNVAALSAPEPLTLNGPAPEDGLAGANTARSTSLATTRSQNPPMSLAVRAGLQRVYLEGMDFMKARVKDVLDDLKHLQCEYYSAMQPNEEEFEAYLKVCDRHLLRANAQLRKRSLQLEVIDSETRLVSLLNQLRELGSGDDGEEDGNNDVDHECVAFLTEFWGKLKSAFESLRAVVTKFQANVLNRLKLNYISYNDTDIHLDVCIQYTGDISEYMKQIEQILTNAQILLKSFDSGVHQDLFQKTPFAELILLSCDLKAFPLLRFVGDVCYKVDCMCHLAYQWLKRDEQFMHEIHDFIRQTRTMTRKREEDLRSQKEKQKKYEKSLKAATILLKNNREKLHKIEAELYVLEQQLNDSEHERRVRHDEMQQKESMADFLKLTLANTKRNYNLQTKRSRLVQQVKELKELLGAMEKDLLAIQDEIHVKSEEKVRLSVKVENGEKSYEALRSDADRISDSLEELESEVTSLSGQLLQLEIIHHLKTSPEKVEEIYDRPSTVKLAPSLKEKIKERKRHVLPKP